MAPIYCGLMSIVRAQGGVGACAHDSPTAAADILSADGECAILDAEGNERHVYRKSSQVTSPQGELFGSVEIVDDRTQVHQLSERIHDMNKMAALGTMASGIAHEIRNPLTVLKMLYHSLGLEFQADDPRAEDVRIMGEKMDHLNTIVEQVLTFARNAEPQLQPTDVNKLINDLRILVRRKIAHQTVDLETRLAKALPQISADAPQLSQAFLNLTLNALEAMPDGGHLTIETRAIHLPKSAPEPTHIRIEFTDTGCGMDADTRERAFTSLLNTSKPGGTGLGLAIVGRIVESHAGLIEIKPSPSGTTFSILLPATG